MRLRLPLLFLAAVACLYPAAAGAGTFSGVVVAKQQARHAVVVASRSGAVHTFRVTSTRARVGSRVTVAASRLADGTFRASAVKVSGRARHVRVHGVIARRTAARYLVSAGGSVIAVKRAAARRTASLGDSGPNTGAVVNAEVEIEDDGELAANSVQQVGQTGVVEIEGRVLALSPFQVSVEGLPVTITVPAGVTLPTTLRVGDRVQLAVSVAANNVFTLVSLKDENAQGDDNEGVDVEDGAQNVQAEGTVVSVSATQLVVQPGEHSTPVTFAVPPGFDLTGATQGAKVEAKGTLVNGTLTLTKLEVKGQDEGDNGDNGDENGGGGGGDD